MQNLTSFKQTSAGNISCDHNLAVDGNLTVTGTTTTVQEETITTLAGINFTSTIDKGINFASGTPAYGDTDDAFIAIGTYNDAKTIANVSAYSFVPIQVNLSSTGNNAVAGNQVAAMRLRVDTDTNAQGNTAISCLQLRSDLGTNVYAATGISGSTNISANIAVPTASVQGIYYQITGAGAVTCPNEPNVMEIGYHQSSGGGGFINVAQFDSNATGCSITNIVRLKNYAGTVTSALAIEGTFTNDIIFASGGTVKSSTNTLTFEEATLTFTGSTAINLDGLTTTIGTAGTDSLVVTAKLASQLYHNLSDQSYTVLKIHNHDTTAEIGGLETKGELINTTGSIVGEQASWSYEPTGFTGTPTGVSASSNVIAIAPSHIVTTGNIYALVGETQLYGTLNGAAVNVAGVIGVVGGNGANTQVLHMTGVQSAMSTGLVNPTTGTLSYYLANSLSTVVVDNLICSLQSQYVTNFVSFDAAATDKCVEANTATPSGAVAHIIRVLIGGVAGYVPVYANKPT